MRTLLLPMLMLAACDGSNGMTPCHGTIVTTFTGGTWDDGTYTRTLTLENGDTSCEFVLPGGECNGLPVVVEGDTLVIEHWSGTSVDPETVGVVLERDGAVLHDSTVTPAWTEEEPLSAGSGTCWSTDIDIDLGA